MAEKKVPATAMVERKRSGNLTMEVGYSNGRPCTLINSFGPIPMLLWCPQCGERHIDVGRFATIEREHHTHACQFCGHCWRPAVIPTVGVRFLPDFKDGEGANG